MPAALKWGETGLVVFDAVTAEAPGFEVAITDYPVELGANLLDHVRMKPLTLRLTAVVSNSPAREGLSHMGTLTPGRGVSIQIRDQIVKGAPHPLNLSSFSGIPLVKAGRANVQVRTYAPATERIQRVELIYAELRRALAEAREFTITTSMLGDFDHMLLKSFHTDRDASSGTGLKMELEFQQVMYAVLSRRDVSALLPKPKKPEKARSAPVKDEGKAAPAAAPATPAKDQSTADGLIENLTDWVAPFFAQ
jgi:hypothetical protein